MKLTVLQSTQKDAERIARFYQQYKNPQLDPVDSTKLILAAESGRFVFVENNLGLIQHINMIKVHGWFEETQHRLRTWTEVGSSLGILNGLGIYPRVYSLSNLIATVLYPATEYLYTCMYRSNESSRKMVSEGCHLPEFRPDERMMRISGDFQKRDNIIWFKSDDESLRHQARIVRDWIERPIVVKDGINYEFLFPSLPEAVRDLIYDLT